MSLRTPFVCFATLAVLLVAFATAEDPETGFVPLVHPGATELAETFDFVAIPPGSVRLLDGEIRIAGEPRGYLATRAKYGNFTLRFEWRYDVSELAADSPEADGFEANGGVLLRIDGPAKVWPTALQVQLAPDDPGDLIALDGTARTSRDTEALRDAIRSPGHWNEAEITLKGDQISSRLNGAEVASSRYPANSGPIGFQSQGTSMAFRRIRIRPETP